MGEEPARGSSTEGSSLMEPALALDKSKAFDRERPLGGQSLHFHPGEIHVIVEERLKVDISIAYCNLLECVKCGSFSAPRTQPHQQRKFEVVSV